MTFYKKLERKFSKYAISNLMKYICVIYIVGFFIVKVNPMFYFAKLSLNPAMILRGEIWRIVTFVFYPPSTSIIWMMIALFVYYSLGTTLENVWGAFKYNLFFIMGIILLVIASIILQLAVNMGLVVVPTGIVIILPVYMSFSIFLAYALTFPEATFLFYFIIPVKAKYLAIFQSVLYCIYFLMGNVVDKVNIAVTFFNVVLFFYMINKRPKRSKVINVNDFR